MNVSLDILPLWAVFLSVLFIILLAVEVGYRLGRSRHTRSTDEKEAPVGGIVATELGLLAFLLAFTFGIAASRFDARRLVLLDEANAIGTAYLRAAMLPEPHRTEVRRLLREYVDLRIEAAEEEVSGQVALRRSEEIHGRLWDETVAVAGENPRSVPVGLFIQILNDVIDLHAKRLEAGLRSRIPKPVWGVLLAVAFLSFGAMGYHAGLSGTSRSPSILAVALTFAVVIWLVVDLDRPEQGLLQVSEQALYDLRNTMTIPKR